MGNNSIGPFISLILRHKPENVGLTLDKNGWVAVEDLIAGINATGKYTLTHDELSAIVEDNNKKRYEYSPDGLKIRARQGHSVKVDTGLKAAVPPPVLYHGTTDKYVKEIFKKGLLPQRRLHVHLSKDIETATQVGSRHGKPVILEVDTRELVKNNHKFYLSANGVWLSESVPASSLKILR